MTKLLPTICAVFLFFTITARATASEDAGIIFIAGSAEFEPHKFFNDRAVVSSVRKAVRDLRENLGTNQPQFFLVSDNLNRPKIVSRELKRLLVEAPFAGLSTDWNDQLPFPREKIDAVAKGKRGIQVLALCGKIKAQCQTLDLSKLEIKQTGQDWNQYNIELDSRAIQVVSNCFPRFDPAPGGQTAIFSFNYLLRDHLCRRAYANALFDVFRRDAVRFWNFNTGSGFLYANDKVLTNSAGILKITGEFRYVDGPLTCFDCFQAHPFEEITGLLGRDNLDVMSHADRVECFRVKYHYHFDGSGQRPTAEIIGSGKEQNRDFASAVLDEIVPLKGSYGGAVSYCSMFDPGVLLRFWRGKHSADLLICFHCDELATKGGYILEFRRGSVLKLCQKAFPDDKEIQDLK